MAAEQFTNNAATTLSAALETTDGTSIAIASADGFPTAAQYRVLVDNELMLVTAGAGTTTWTVTRGAESTTAATHLLGAPVTHVLTAGALGAFGRKLVDTAANIKAAAAASYDWGLATDTLEVFWSDGATWRKLPFALVLDGANPDMGYTQASNRLGLGSDYLTDKLIANSRIGSNNATAAEGAIRVLAGVLGIYLSSVWKDVVTGFRFREDSSGAYELEHMPIGFSEWYELLSGNSNTLGLNGLPLVQVYAASMGAYPAPVRLDGGSL